MNKNTEPAATAVSSVFLCFAILSATNNISHAFEKIIVPGFLNCTRWDIYVIINYICDGFKSEDF